MAAMTSTGAAGRRLERLLPVISIVAMGVLWWVGNRYTRFIASPTDVLGSLPTFLSDSETWVHIGLTLWRVAAGLFIGVLAGTTSALLMSRFHVAKKVLGVYVALALRVPSTIAAIVAIAMFQRSELGYLLVVAVITFPFIVIGLLDGLEEADTSLEEMVQVYHVGTTSRIRHLLLPFIAPFVFSSLRNAHALAWKVIVVAEIFGAAARGFGGRFNHAFDHFELEQLMLWLLVFVAFVLSADYGVLRAVERRVFRWRPTKE